MPKVLRITEIEECTLNELAERMRLSVGINDDGDFTVYDVRINGWSWEDAGNLADEMRQRVADGCDADELRKYRDMLTKAIAVLDQGIGALRE